MSTIIRSGTVVGPYGSSVTDLRIDGEQITALGSVVESPDDQVIDATGCLVFPGGIDTHTHLDLATQGTTTVDDFNTGTRAAVLGGTTLVMDFATAQKGETLATGLANWNAKAAGKAWCDYAFHMAMLEWPEGRADEMRAIAAQGVTSFKMYMAYRPAMMVEDDEIFQALQATTSFGGTIGFHAENGRLIDELTKSRVASGQTGAFYHQHTHPVEVEREAISRLAAISELAGHVPCYAVHLSSAAGLTEVLRANGRGVAMRAETCPQYLLLDSGSYGSAEGSELNEISGFVISPPLREVSDQDKLWDAVATGAVQFIGTDHCAFNVHGQKDAGGDDFRTIPNGAPGIQLRMELLYTYGVLTGRISLERYVELNATNAARYFGVYPRKGILAPGSDADVVIYDPRGIRVVHQSDLDENVDYTPYEDWTITGRVRDVFVRGSQAVRDGALVGSQSGQFIGCGPCDGRIR
ncbi:dihydropyrimidinase [Propionimicrobium sp. PCR01-08-3]|uniref:dihydropyrimidinase n=1 Tax=Propionimicrobium sp. PCR01-08-3 TaxID=3052086 RepID=UPI00255CEF6D|nr:dihydropyrimidinase [Propionimicrobium sp. PCR01-08-3]WIY82529.1 dihydropyrimidinase [Propionimicrobium sp. PCR01-08-3]